MQIEPAHASYSQLGHRSSWGDSVAWRTALWRKRRFLVVTFVITLLSVGVSLWLNRLPEPPIETSFLLPSDGPPDAIVVLVHGTFFPDAPWVQPTSALPVAIGRALAPRRVLFKTFVWTGLFGGRYNNTNAVRRGAAKRLGDVLVALHAEWPAAPIFIVAHSHGANVVLYAARDLASAVPLAGLVSMGTPFLEVRPRRFRDDTALVATIEGIASICWIVLLGLSACAGVCVLSLGLKIGMLRGWLSKLIAVPVILVGVVLIIWMVRVDKKNPYRYVSVRGHVEVSQNYTLSEATEQLRKSVVKLALDLASSWARRRQEDLMQLSSVLPPDVPMLVLRSEEDEVLVGLPLPDKVSNQSVGFLASPRTATIVVTLGLSACFVAAAFAGLRGFIGVLRGGKRTGRDWLLALFIGSIEGWFVLIPGIMLGVCALVVVTPLSVVARAPLGTPSLAAYGTLTSRQRPSLKHEQGSRQSKSAMSLQT